jgi:hypothetical protein
MPITRSVFVCVAATLIAGSGAVAHAESGMLPNGAQIRWDKVFITEDGEITEPTTPDVLRQYLNLAHCACSQAGAGDETTISYQVSLTVDTNTNRPADVFVGTQCEDELLRPMKCLGINTIPDIDTLATRPENLDFSLYQTINSVDNTGPCQQREGDAFAWVLVDSDADNNYDYFSNQAIGNTSSTAAADAVKVDTQPPPLPTEFKADSAEGAISLEWTVPESRATDIFYYQALCAGPDGMPALSTPPEPRYQTVRTLCGLEQDIALPASEVESADTGTATLTPELMQLDPRYICGDTDEATATGMLIEGLQNDVPYTVVLLAIDFNGNATGTYLTRTITPRPATDFWEDLHDRGSDVEGGFCLMAETYGDDSDLTQSLRAFRDETLASSVLGRALIDAYYGTLGKLGVYVHGSIALRIAAGIVLAPLVVVALAWHTLTLPGLLGLLAFIWLVRRRRQLALRLARFAVPALLTVLVLAPSPARAQGITPYWEQDAADAAADDDTVRWHAGLRVGPYTPEIDKQFGMDPGPYREMFGKYQIMPMIDIDRILWRGFGEIGIGGSIGYMQKSANAWADGSTPGDPMRERSPGDKNTFRLIPLALTAVYRFTYLDDEWSIPLVPYLRGGLSYYVWWMRTNNSTSTACWDGTHDAGCDKDKAYGATLGLQGAIGLSIRAERIDAAAATSMRQGGIQHAGFYAELSLAKVNGFGSDTKLSVGDTTWFAGVDFEF